MVKVGLVGFGSWGRRHYENWNRIPEADLVGVYDPACKGSIFKDSLDSLLGMVDAVDIVVPASRLTETAISALEHSRHVLIEKPMSTDLAEARRLENVANSRKDLVAMVGFIERFNPVFIKLRSIIRSLEGPAKIFCQRSGSPTLVAKQTGVLKDLAIHDLDLLRWYLGEPDTIAVRSREGFYFSQVEARFGRTEAIVISDCLGPKIRRWVLTYPHDSVFAFYEADKWRLYMNNVEVAVDWSMPLERELRYFLECIRRGEKPTPSIKDGLRVLEMIEKALIQS
ncbi:Gfo/Idh/MocA family oxidoreductase [Candidatus Bathyarchaeota archaeon]|nr:Gfo/Idh/MocA family oxidoreductase [Candidatus Bathyarchaeota archaeon]